MSEPLRPCPFCGGKPELISGAPGCHFVMCSECTVSSDVMSKERTVAAWNLRDPEAEAHPPPCPQCGNNPDGHAVEHDPDTGMPVMVCRGVDDQEVLDNFPRDPKDALIASLVEALRQYADLSNWGALVCLIGPEVARDALAKAEGK